MGASGWTFFVPYQPDIKQAFLQLKQQVIDQQDFYRPYLDFEEIQQMLVITSENIYDQLEEEGSLPQSVQWCFPAYTYFAVYREQMAQKWPLLKQTPHIRTVEDFELHRFFALADTDGSHSPLDLEIGEGMMFPLAPEHLLSFFGTLQPNRVQVDDFFKKGGFEQCTRETLPYHKGQGVYFTIYAQGIPVEICFDGATGD